MATNYNTGFLAFFLAVLLFVSSATVYAANNNSSGSGFSSPSVKIKQFRESR